MNTKKTGFAALAKWASTAIAAIGLVLVAGACAPADKKVASGSPEPAAVVANPATTVAAPVTTPPTSASVTITMPDLRGKNLQIGTDQLVALGVKVVSHDSTGQGRTPFMYSNWSITTQDPATGTVTLPVTADLGAKKFGE